MKERVKKGSDEKREDALIQERKRTAILQKLKEQGGPFTSAEEVDDYLRDVFPKKNVCFFISLINGRGPPPPPVFIK
ncbi:MAG: hypothetical protein QF722_07025, partial [Candidatus Thalassarchaeaceae archaeon]|nr:hypothetical protein [Candidatus Thalassarchaeaceae archaeon]